MAQAKKPQDHKPKQVDGKTVTVDGIKVTISVDAIDDFELLDDLAQMQDGNAARIVSACKRLFGDDYSRILDELRVDGRVKTSRVSQFFMDVFKAVAPNS